MVLRTTALDARQLSMVYKIEPAEASGTQQRMVRIGWFSETLNYFDENRETARMTVVIVRGLEDGFVR